MMNGRINGKTIKVAFFYIATIESYFHPKLTSTLFRHKNLPMHCNWSTSVSISDDGEAQLFGSLIDYK